MQDFPSTSKPTIAPQNMAQKRVQRHRRLFVFLCGLCIFVLGIAAGSLVTTYTSPSNSSGVFGGASAKTEADFSLFWDVWNAVKKDHVQQPVDEKKMLYGAIEGMVAGVGDPYSSFFPPEESEAFMKEINGEFDGIGAQIGLKKEKIVVIAPISDSPAEKAGLQAGDVILTIDDKSTEAMSLDQAVTAIRGQKGTQVKIRLQRGDADPYEVTITRDTIHVDSVTTRDIEKDGKRITVIELSQFSDASSKELQSVVATILTKRPDAIILDLRNNPGGYLDAAVDTAGLFLPSGSPVVYERMSDGKDDPHTSSGTTPFAGIPTVVLMNQGSASASEIVAGALQDYKKATVVGTTSFGKGTVQDVRSFDDGSALKLTIAQWLTPNKSAIHQKGVVPDFYVDLTEEDYENDRDPQMDAAVLFFTNNNEFLNTVKPPTEEQKKSEAQEALKQE